jgi:hypothetical protein
MFSTKFRETKVESPAQPLHGDRRQGRDRLAIFINDLHLELMPAFLRFLEADPQRYGAKGMRRRKLLGENRVECSQDIELSRNNQPRRRTKLQFGLSCGRTVRATPCDDNCGNDETLFAG